MSIFQSLDVLPRSVLIEVVYLIGHRLTHKFPIEQELDVGNRALSRADEVLAKDAALAVIREIEIVDGEIDNLTPVRRSDLVAQFHQVLREHIGHAGKVRERASAQLDELEGA